MAWWRHQMDTFFRLVNFPHKGQSRGALIFSLICAWINGWINNREAGDFRRQQAQYDVTVMVYLQSKHNQNQCWLTITRNSYNDNDRGNVCGIVLGEFFLVGGCCFTTTQGILNICSFFYFSVLWCIWLFKCQLDPLSCSFMTGVADLNVMYSRGN